MVEKKVKILTKIALDSLYIIFVLVTFFVVIFSYETGINVYLTKIGSKDSDDTTSLSDEKDSQCRDGVESENWSICIWLQDWEEAGIIYLVLASLSILFCIYGIVRLGLRLAGKDFSFRVKFDLEYYIFSVLSLFALILYIVSSDMFSDLIYSTTLDGEMNSYSPQIEAGFILMILAFLISLGSSIYFLLARKDLEQKSELKKPLLSNKLLIRKYEK